MKKYLLLVLLLFGVQFVYWASVMNYDCLMSTNYEASLDSLFEKKQKYWILERDDVELALQHLNAYCCAKKYLINWCKSQNNEIPESPYLSDHLVDAVMRKLDAMDVMYGFKPDPDAKQRRQDIRQTTEKTQWDTPSAIYDKFKSTWKVWETWWIYQKYREWCDGVVEILSNMIKIQTNIDQTNETVDLVSSNCQLLATNRANKEMNYVQQVMFAKWIQMLQDNLKEYIQEYFMKKKMDVLIEKFKNFVWLFWSVAQKLNEWTSNCWW